MKSQIPGRFSSRIMLFRDQTDRIQLEFFGLPLSCRHFPPPQLSAYALN
jgi:hypothetical protein